MVEVEAARAAARARFAHFAEDDSDDEPGHGAVDPDNPPMTDEDLARLRPVAEVAPALVAASLRKGGRPRLPAPKVAVSIRLDADIVIALRSSGDGWQGRVNDTLRAALSLPSGSDVAAAVHTAIGKRTFSRGSVQVHTVVESREVSEGLTLEVETVTVDRRVADRLVAVRTSDGEVREDMDVVGSDGVLVGTVASVEGAGLRVRTSRDAAGGRHHYLPWSTVESVAEQVTLAVTADEAEVRSATA